MTEPSPTDARAALTVLSAADERYARCLYQLLLSAERLREPARTRFVVFDLGLGAEREPLAQRFPWCRWREVDLRAWPPHVWQPLRQNGWKPLVIEQAVRTDGGLLLWLDSATVLKAPLDPVAREIRRRAIYSLRGQAPVAERCDAAILDALQVPPDTRRSPEHVTGVLGLDCAAPAVRRLVERWRELALEPRYLGTRSATHMAEQALLGIVLYEMQAKGEIRLGEDEIDISSPSPVSWMSSRNRVSPRVPWRADPFVRLYYAAGKAIDQALWRLRRSSPGS